MFSKSLSSSILIISSLILFIILLLSTSSSFSSSVVATQFLWPEDVATPTNNFIVNEQICNQLRGQTAEEDTDIQLRLSSFVADPVAPIIFRFENCRLGILDFSETTVFPENSQIIIKNNYFHEHGAVRFQNFTTPFGANTLIEIDGNTFFKLAWRAIWLENLVFDASSTIKITNNFFDQWEKWNLTPGEPYYAQRAIDMRNNIFRGDHTRIIITDNFCDFSNFRYDPGMTRYPRVNVDFQCVGFYYSEIFAAQLINMSSNRQLTGSGDSETATVFFQAHTLTNVHSLLFDHNSNELFGFGNAQTNVNMILGATDFITITLALPVRWDNITLLSSCYGKFVARSRSTNVYVVFFRDTEKSLVVRELRYDPAYTYMRNIRHIRFDHNTLDQPVAFGSAQQTVYMVTKIAMYNISLMTANFNNVSTIGYHVASAVFAGFDSPFFLIDEIQFNNNYCHAEMKTLEGNVFPWMFSLRAPYNEARALFIKLDRTYRIAEYMRLPSWWNPYLPQLGIKQRRHTKVVDGGEKEQLYNISDFVMKLELKNNAADIVSTTALCLSLRLWLVMMSFEIDISHNRVGSEANPTYVRNLPSSLIVPNGGENDIDKRPNGLYYEGGLMFISTNNVLSTIHNLSVKHNTAFIAFKYFDDAIPKSAIFIKDYQGVGLVLGRPWNFNLVQIAENKISLIEGWQSNVIEASAGPFMIVLGNGDTACVDFVDCDPPAEAVGANLQIFNNDILVSDMERCRPGGCFAVAISSLVPQTKVQMLNFSNNRFHFKNMQRNLYEGKEAEVGLATGQRLPMIAVIEMKVLDSTTPPKMLNLLSYQFNNSASIEISGALLIADNEILYDNCGGSSFSFFRGAVTSNFNFSLASPPAIWNPNSINNDNNNNKDVVFLIENNDMQIVNIQNGVNDFVKGRSAMFWFEPVTDYGPSSVSQGFMVSLSSLPGGTFLSEERGRVVVRNQQFDSNFPLSAFLHATENYVAFSQIEIDGAIIRQPGGSMKSFQFYSTNRQNEENIGLWQIGHVLIRNSAVVDVKAGTNEGFIQFERGDLNFSNRDDFFNLSVIENSSIKVSGGNAGSIPPLISFSSGRTSSLSTPSSSSDLAAPQISVNLSFASLTLDSATPASPDTIVLPVGVVNNLPPSRSFAFFGNSTNITMSNSRIRSSLVQFDSQLEGTNDDKEAAIIEVFDMSVTVPLQGDRSRLIATNEKQTRLIVRTRCLSWNRRPLRPSENFVGPIPETELQFERCEGATGFTKTLTASRSTSTVPYCVQGFKLLPFFADSLNERRQQQQQLNTVSRFMHYRTMTVTINIVFAQDQDGNKLNLHQSTGDDFQKLPGQEQSESFTKFRENVEFAWPNNNNEKMKATTKEEQESATKTREFGMPTLSASSTVFSATPTIAVVRRAYAISESALKVELVFPSPAFAEDANPSQAPFQPLDDLQDHTIELIVKGEAFACIAPRVTQSDIDDANLNYDERRQKPTILNQTTVPMQYRVQIPLVGRSRVPNFPPGLRQAIAVGSDVSMVATMAMSSGSMIAKAKARSVLLSRYSDCLFDPEEPLGFELSPLNLQVGSDVGRYLRGAVIGNGVVFVIFTGIIFVLALIWIWYRVHKQEKRIREEKEIAKEKMRLRTGSSIILPGIKSASEKKNKNKKSPSLLKRFWRISLSMGLMPVLLNLQTILMQGSVSASISLYLYGPYLPSGLRAFDRGMAVICVGASFVFGVWMLYAVLYQLPRFPTIQYVTKEEDEAQKRRARAGKKPSSSNSAFDADDDSESPEEDEVVQYILHVNSKDCAKCAEERPRNRRQLWLEERRRLRRARSRRNMSLSMLHHSTTSLAAEESDLNGHSIRSRLRPEDYRNVTQRTSAFGIIGKFLRNVFSHSGSWKTVKFNINEQQKNSNNNNNKELVESAAKTKKKAKKFFDYFADLFYDLSNSLPPYFAFEYALFFIMACIEGYHPSPTSPSCETIGTLLAVLNVIPLGIALAYYPIMRHWCTNSYMILSGTIITIQSVVMLLGFYDPSLDLEYLAVITEIFDIAFELIDIGQLSFDLASLYVESPAVVIYFVRRTKHTFLHSDWMTLLRSCSRRRKGIDDEDEKKEGMDHNKRLDDSNEGSNNSNNNSPDNNKREPKRLSHAQQHRRAGESVSAVVGNSSSLPPSPQPHNLRFLSDTGDSSNRKASPGIGSKQFDDDYNNEHRQEEEEEMTLLSSHFSSTSRSSPLTSNSRTGRRSRHSKGDCWDI